MVADAPVVVEIQADVDAPVVVDMHADSADMVIGVEANWKATLYHAFGKTHYDVT